ncbi:MAG: RnfABCDGE type electron transport complex subunit A [Defluviitaleaceae bacterium]|nr:RnfABCDGE type electron transport complex subunit A [Defluviitaleaceae bacterium]
MEYLSLFIGATLVTNIILASFLGICPVIGVSKKVSSALGMGGAVIFVTVVSSAATWLIYHLLLVGLGLEFMRTIVFILIVASLVQFVEMFMKKFTPALYKVLGVFLPLMATNCAIIGAALINIDRDFTFTSTIVHAFGVSIGFTLVIFIFSTIRERLETSNTPEGFKGVPIALVVVTIMAMGFFGFVGLGS